MSALSNNNSEEEETPIQPPIDSESWCRYVSNKSEKILLGVFPRTKISEDVKHTFAWTIERFSERQEPNSQVGQTNPVEPK